MVSAVIVVKLAVPTLNSILYPVIAVIFVVRIGSSQIRITDLREIGNALRFFGEPTKTPEPTKELELASFVDKSKDPQSYVDRYNKEPSYKKWFDTNFPQYSSIYEAVGLTEPKTDATKVEKPKFGICGTGTKLIDGICTVIDVSKAKSWWKFW